ncbi:Uncharacterised protein [Klebsiella pneumoniae]|nr:Uncharacterised protein [Klebsiella pneumoniae]STU99701.1 Uncharacterised protein [Klebsiella pneumoniae]
MQRVFEFPHIHAFIDFLLQRIGNDLLFLQGVTVVLTVRIYAGERIIHLIASLLLHMTVSGTVCFRVNQRATGTRRRPVQCADANEINQTSQ